MLVSSPKARIAESGIREGAGGAAGSEGGGTAGTWVETGAAEVEAAGACSCRAGGDAIPAAGVAAVAGRVRAKSAMTGRWRMRSLTILLTRGRRDCCVRASAAERPQRKHLHLHQ